MKHWFITGVSRGLGLAIAEAALARGDKVVGTVRRADPDLFPGQDNVKVLTVDMSEEQGVIEVVAQAFDTFGRIDVIVNNAGYGLLGAVEGTSDEELQSLFKVNVFTPIRIVRAALPRLRAQGNGHIVNITSIAGRAPGVGSALYAASKFALEGFSAALAQEVEPLGIHVTAIAPGQFRTEFLSDTSVRRSGVALDAYSSTVGNALATLSGIHDHQLGDPDLAARAIVETVHSEQPPRQLLLGSDALARERNRQSSIVQEMERWEQMTLSTDFKNA